jgi:hypothetical protein
VQDDDEPTVPHLPRISPSPPTEAATSWPQVETRILSALTGGVSTTALAIALAVSLVANGVLLGALVSALVFARTGAFAPHEASSLSTPGATGVASATIASASPTPGGGWLHVAPTSVRLGCDGGQDTQFVVLANTGVADVQWQVEFSVSADQAGVAVDPMQGDLSAGTSVALQISNTFQAGAQRGVLRFAPDSSAAGEAPGLSYTTSSCA